APTVGVGAGGMVSHQWTLRASWIEAEQRWRGATGPGIWRPGARFRATQMFGIFAVARPEFISDSGCAAVACHGGRGGGGPRSDTVNPFSTAHARMARERSRSAAVAVDAEAPAGADVPADCPAARRILRPPTRRDAET